MEFIALTHTLYTSTNGEWKLQKSFDVKKKKPCWYILKRIKGEEYKRVGKEFSLDDAKTLADDFTGE